MTLAQVVALLIFIVTFIGILSERLHRTIVAMAGATVMLGAGMLMGFYSQEQALASIDFRTLGLLLGMMMIVGLLEQSGFFQYIAITVAKRSRGNPYLLLVILGLTTSLLSMFLDNVTTVVIIVPITILITEILGINSIPFLIAVALLSNTGGVATLVGDPPNVIIGSAANFSFGDFLTHLAPIVAIAWLVALLVIGLVFRAELAKRPSGISALMSLREGEALRDRKMLKRALVTLGFVIIFFFLEERFHLTSATIALGGAAVALVWAQPNMEETLRHVEWSVLLFFAALFVTIGGLEASGLLDLLATEVVGLSESSLLGASLLLLWIAAIVSAVVDNIPFTIGLVPVIQQLGALGINVSPLWWALALGAGFGGNGTPIGSTANVITVAFSEKTRSPINLRVWLRSGLPVMLATCVVASILFVMFFGLMQTP